MGSRSGPSTGWSRRTKRSLIPTHPLVASSGSGQWTLRSHIVLRPYGAAASSSFPFRIAARSVLARLRASSASMFPAWSTIFQTRRPPWRRQWNEVALCARGQDPSAEALEASVLCRNSLGALFGVQLGPYIAAPPQLLIAPIGAQSTCRTLELPSAYEPIKRSSSASARRVVQSRKRTQRGEILATNNDLRAGVALGDPYTSSSSRASRWRSKRLLLAIDVIRSTFIPVNCRK